MRQWISRRPTLGFSATISRELTIEDQAEFLTMFWMTKKTFDDLLQMIYPHILKQDEMQHDKLFVTLRYLATG